MVAIGSFGEGSFARSRKQKQIVSFRPKSWQPRYDRVVCVYVEVSHYLIRDNKLTFDPIERRAEKQAQRDVDAEALARGDVHA